MKLSTAPAVNRPKAHAARKNDSFQVYGGMLEDTCSLEELETVWASLDTEHAEHIPEGWMGQLWEVYQDHKEILKGYL